jgi:hypothetical protein
MFVVSSASAGDRQSLPHFYCDHPARKSTNRFTKSDEEP